MSAQDEAATVGTLQRRAVAGAAAAVAAILAGAATLLLAMGRTVWCQCGRIALWSGNVWSNENSQQLADPYSFTHITHGIIFFWLLAAALPKSSVPLRLVAATLVESAWEVVENTDFVINRYRAVTMSLDYYGDSIFNSTGDVLFCVMGFVLAAQGSGRAALLGTLALELALIFWIRDSLLLNIIMLLFPMDAVRTWQLGG